MSCRTNRGAPHMSRKLYKERDLRLQLMERCNGVCEQCGSNGYPFGIHPHEKLFRSLGGELSLSNSIMLCQTCHAKYHIKCKYRIGVKIDNIYSNSKTMQMWLRTRIDQSKGNKLQNRPFFEP